MTDDSPSLLLTGATGYVGGRLLTLLVSRGLPVRCVARQPKNLRARVGPTTGPAAVVDLCAGADSSTFKFMVGTGNTGLCPRGT